MLQHGEAPVYDELWQLVPEQARQRGVRTTETLLRGLGSIAGYGRSMLLHFGHDPAGAHEPLAHSVPLNKKETSHAVVFRSGNVYVVHEPPGDQNGIAVYHNFFDSSDEPYVIQADDMLLAEHSLMRSMVPLDRRLLRQSSRQFEKDDVLAAVHAAVCARLEARPDAHLTAEEGMCVDRLLASI